MAAMVSFVAVPAAAGNPCVVLELTAPEECPSVATIEQTVAELVHNVPNVPLGARATIAKQGERYTVMLVTAAGERTFDGETCQGAADALSVILALAVDPHASTTPTGPAPEAVPTPPPLEPQPAPVAPVASVAPVAPAAPAEPQPKPQAESTGPPAKAEPLTLGGSVLTLVDSGFLPGVAAGAAAAFRLNSGIVSAELSGKFLLPRSTTLEGDPNRGGTFRWAGGGLDACLRVLPPLYSCFGAELGGLTGEGIGIDTPFTRTATIVALTGGAVARGSIGGGFTLEGRLGVAVPMDRPQFGLEGFGELHQPDSVSVRAGFGVAFR